MRTSDHKSTLNMRHKDVLFSLILIVSSIGLIVYAVTLSLQAMKAVNATFYDAPGFSMLVISGGLLVLSSALLVVALRQGGTLRWLAPRQIGSIVCNRSSLKTLVVFIYLFLYMMSCGQLIPGINVAVPFWLSTLVFLFLMMITFKAASLCSVVVISGVCTLLIYLFFGYLAKIPLW